MRAYSLDLRQKIVGAFERGLTKSEVARTFGVSFSSVKRYVKMNAQRGSLAPSKPPGSPPKIDDRARRLLELDLQERPAVGTRPTEEAPHRVGGDKAYGSGQIRCYLHRPRHTDDDPLQEERAQRRDLRPGDLPVA